MKINRLLIIFFLLISFSKNVNCKVQNLSYDNILVQNYSENEIHMNVLFAIARTSNYIHQNLKLSKRIIISFEPDETFRIGTVAYVSASDAHRIHIRYSYANSFFLLKILPHEQFHIKQFETNFYRTVRLLIDSRYINNYEKNPIEIESIKYSKRIRKETLAIFLESLKNIKKYEFKYEAN